jgi:hypothetical protein
MPRLFFPVVRGVPAFADESCGTDHIRAHRRTWQTSTFDLATLATRHKLHLPYQLMDVFLSSVNWEIEISYYGDLENAFDTASIFKVMLYTQGVCPIILPFATSHTLNEYSGINSRDSPMLSAKLPEGLRQGITSNTVQVEAWPHELTFYTLEPKISPQVTQDQILKACELLSFWQELEKRFPELRNARVAADVSPQIHNIGASIVQIWQSIEELFNIGSEISFRASLLVAQLCTPTSSRKETYLAARESYKDRSAASHSRNGRDLNLDQWCSAWVLLLRSISAVLNRGDLPSAETLLEELLENP